MRRSILLVRLVLLAGCGTGDSPAPSHEDPLTQLVLGSIALETRDRDPNFRITSASSCALSR